MVVIGHDTTTGQPVELSATDRAEHLVLPGDTGMGKSTVMLHLILDDIERGVPFCLLDPKGTLVDRVVAAAPRIDPEQLILWDVYGMRDCPIGLNPYDCLHPDDEHLVSYQAREATAILNNLYGDESEFRAWGARLEQILDQAGHVLCANPGFGMIELLMMLDQDPRARSYLIQKVTHPPIERFWTHQFPLLIKGPNPTFNTSSTDNKIDSFVRDVLLYGIVGQDCSTLDFEQLIDSDKGLLVKLIPSRVSKRTANLIGAVLISQILQAAYSRGFAAAPFHLYVDEFYRFSSPALAEGLRMVREFGVSVTLAYQDQEELTDDDTGALGQVGARLVFQTKGDSSYHARFFDASPPAPAIIGQRPRTGISQNPVDMLLHRPHESPQVYEIVDQVLRPLWQTFQSVQPQHYTSYGHRYPQVTCPIETGQMAISSPSGSHEELQQGINAINRYLVYCMASPANSAGATDLLMQILIPLCAYGGYGHQIDPIRVTDSLNPFEAYHSRSVHREDESAFPWLQALRAYVSALLLGKDGQAELQNYGRERIAAWMRHLEFLAALKEHKLQGTYVGYIDYPDRKAEARLYQHNPEHLTLFQPVKNQFLSIAEQIAVMECTSLVPFVNYLLELGQTLRQMPILQETGQYDPIYDRRRPLSDVRDDIANTLAMLRKYQARCRFGDTECTISTTPPPPMVGRWELQDRLRMLLAHTQNVYGTPLGQAHQAGAGTTVHGQIQRRYEMIRAYDMTKKQAEPKDETPVREPASSRADQPEQRRFQRSRPL